MQVRCLILALMKEQHTPLPALHRLCHNPCSHTRTVFSAVEKVLALSCCPHVGTRCITDFTRLPLHVEGTRRIHPKLPHILSQVIDTAAQLAIFAALLRIQRNPVVVNFVLGEPADLAGILQGKPVNNSTKSLAHPLLIKRQRFAMLVELLAIWSS